MVQYRVSQLLADPLLKIEDLATTQHEVYGSAKFNREHLAGLRWSESAVNYFTGRFFRRTHNPLLVEKPVVDIALERYFL